MSITHNQTHQRKLLPCVLYTLIPLALLHYYIYISPLGYVQTAHKRHKSIVTSDSMSPEQEQSAELKNLLWCDYSNGHWVQTKVEPLYNGTSCETIKLFQNCLVNGRPNTGYLYWQWQPKDSRCPAPVFDASLFLGIIRNKHLAFIGDSLARNQVESLICLLSTRFKPGLVYQDNNYDPKFRRWVFDEYNATVSAFWSPFLVNGIQNDYVKGIPHNTLYLDTPNEKWASELDKIDIVVFTIGRWFDQKAMYYGKGNQLLGCNAVQDLNCTDLNFFDAFHKAVRTALKEVTKRFYKSDKAVVVATFTSGHFEGAWDMFGTCLKTEPYKEGDIEMPYLEKEMRKSVIEEVAMAVKDVKEMSGGLRIEALDVTKLTFLRPDGHPGPYMIPNPFANGKKERVQNDCVHWCLPGPIDTWNAILLELMKRWKDE